MAYTYWRINVTLPSSGNSGEATRVNKIEMYSVVEGSDECNGGVASTNTAYSQPDLAFDAYDDSVCTLFHYPAWLQYQFPSAVNIVSYSIRASLTEYTTKAPGAWTIEASNDGVNWIICGEEFNQINWTVGEVRTFTSYPIMEIANEYSSFSDSIVVEQSPVNRYVIQIDDTIQVSDVLSERYDMELNDTISMSEMFEYPESAHPYLSDLDFTWTYLLTGNPTSIDVTFSSLTSVESDCDYIYVMDAAGNNITGSPFTGTALAGTTKTITGDTVKIRLTSDGSVEEWGFEVTGVTGAAPPSTIEVSDSLDMSEATINSPCRPIVDWLFTATTLGSSWKGTYTIADILSLSETFTVGFDKPIADTVDAADATSRALGLPVKDYIFTTCTVDSSGRFQRAISDLLTVFPIASLYNFALLDLADSVGVVDTNRADIGALLREYLTAVDSSGASGRFNRSVSDALLALDAAINGRGYSALLSDTIGTSDALTALVWVLCSASDAVAAVDTVTPLRTSLPALADSITIATTVANRGSLKEMLADSISFRITLVLGGETYQCWSFAGDEMFASLYSNYGFNSFASLGGKDYGCNATGIYLLEGADDAGTAIESGIRVNYSNMGTHQKKRLYHAFFGLSGSDPVLKVITGNGEAEYYIVGNKAHIAKGLCGANWELILTGIDDLDFIEITPVILSR